MHWIERATNYLLYDWLEPKFRMEPSTKCMCIGCGQNFNHTIINNLKMDVCSESCLEVVKMEYN